MFNKQTNTTQSSAGQSQRGFGFGAKDNAVNGQSQRFGFGKENQQSASATTSGFGGFGKVQQSQSGNQGFGFNKQNQNPQGQSQTQSGFGFNKNNQNLQGQNLTQTTTTTQSQGFKFGTKLEPQNQTGNQGFGFNKQNPQGQQQNGNTQGFGGFKQNQQSQSGTQGFNKQGQVENGQGFGFNQQGQTLTSNQGFTGGFKQTQTQSGFGFNKQNQNQGQTLTTNQGFTGGFKQTQTGNQGFGFNKQNQNQGQTLTVNQSDQPSTTQQGPGFGFKTNQFSGNVFKTQEPQNQSGTFLQKQGGFSGFQQGNGNPNTQNQGFSGFNKDSQKNQQGQILTTNQGFTGGFNQNQTQTQVKLPMTGFINEPNRALPESGFIKPQNQGVQLPLSGFVQKDNQEVQHNYAKWQTQNGSEWQSDPQNRTEQNQVVNQQGQTLTVNQGFTGGFKQTQQSQNQNGFRGYNESTQLPFHKEQQDISISNPYGKSKYTDLNSNLHIEETNGPSLVRPLPNYKITPRKTSPKTATMVKPSSQSKMIQPSSESPLFDQKKRAEIWGKSFPEEGNTPYKSRKVNQIRLRDDLPIIPDGYYSVPSVEEMSSMPSLEKLPFFTLGRKDFGEITFDGEVDVSNVDFSNIVSINKLTIQVYPEQSTKPRIGEGFNRKSLLKLFNCYPIDKQGHRITDEKSMRSFQSKLQRKTEEFGDYISYEPCTGTWSFQVDHF